VKLEGREGILYRCCKRFRHFAWKCRSKEGQKKKMVLGSYVMQCVIREVRRQEVVDVINHLPEPKIV